MWTTARGDPEYSGQKKPKRTFPFETIDDFRNLWHNGKHPRYRDVEYNLGNYKKLDPEHRCSSGPTSTTEHWFGLKMDDV